ncbi:ABC transporter ATP-binding protein [Thermoclostridium caenicola]|uniref:Iron complex transport system ATP-binding protein n=1 Tax=Thermoclostridium caenicola TaxID=659425 RepID=A0A1M6JF05_9FIRM|nr:ABC transporter ATP-binding protein [Thermoclostridium caenicola]SHJ45268.1 iron complex transport system ATP-binding protein [Thermoclostridium caenicola]
MKILSSLQARRLVAGYGKKLILDNVDVVVPPNKISVIIGANACGKSTLLKTLARLIKPTSGEVMLDGKDIHAIHPKKVAKKLGLLPQSPVVPEGITVADLVSRGRFPHQNLMGGLKKSDYEAVKEALDIMGISHLANRSVDELSGGQRQRVWIAMALAQQTDILLLDEPTTYLDIACQIEILDLLTALNRKRGTTIVMVLHDINLAARYADHIFCARDGVIIAQGPPEDTITEEMIKKVFNLDCMVIEDPVTGRPFIVPRGRHHTRMLSEPQAV